MLENIYKRVFGEEGTLWERHGGDMAYIQERREELLCAADELMREHFPENIRFLEELYKREGRRREAAEAFANLARQWKESAREGKKAACLGICYLYSNILRKDHSLRLVLMGEAFWLDGEPAEADWEPYGFAECFEKDMKLIMEKLRGRFIRLCRAEEDAIRQWCAEYYLAAIGRLCADLVGEIAEQMRLEETERTDDFYFFFGHYQGEGEIIWRGEKEEGQNA